MQKSERVNFGSKIGAVLAAAGSAVGLGNIWRFPYETGNHGGAAFILVYLACVFMLGMPIMIAEFTVGRHSKASTGRAYKVLAPGTHWKWLGYLGVLAGFLILGYYSVVAGWTLEYILEAGMNGFADKKPEDFVVAFQSFSKDPVRPLIWLDTYRKGRRKNNQSGQDSHKSINHTDTQSRISQFGFFPKIRSIG